MKVVAIYEPKKPMEAKIKDNEGNEFYAPVLFIVVTEKGKLIPCVGGRVNTSIRGKSGMVPTDVAVAFAENYIEMVVD